MAALRLHQAAGQRQAQAGALVLLAVAVVELLEFDEQPRQIVGGDADAGVLDLDAEGQRPGSAGTQRDPTAFGRELDGVGQVVVEHLLEACRVEHQAVQRRIDVDFKVQLLVHQHAVEYRADIAHQAAQVHRLGAEVELARLDLGQVEHVVDQAQQVVAAAADVAQELLMLGRCHRHSARVQQLGEADDRVQRRAQLMRHVGEELALQPAGLEDLAVLGLQPVGGRRSAGLAGPVAGR